MRTLSAGTIVFITLLTLNLIGAIQTSWIIMILPLILEVLYVAVQIASQELQKTLAERKTRKES